MKYTLRKIIEDNEVNLELDFVTTALKSEADYLESVLPKNISMKTRIRIACSLLRAVAMSLQLEDEK
jgi:hypothetical protein